MDLYAKYLRTEGVVTSGMWWLTTSTCATSGVILVVCRPHAASRLLGTPLVRGFRTSVGVPKWREKETMHKHHGLNNIHVYTVDVRVSGGDEHPFKWSCGGG